MTNALIHPASIHTVSAASYKVADPGGITLLLHLQNPQNHVFIQS